MAYMHGSQAANHTHDLLRHRIHLCCEIFQPSNWKWGRTLFRDSTSSRYMCPVMTATTYWFIAVLSHPVPVDQCKAFIGHGWGAGPGLVPIQGTMKYSPERINTNWLGSGIVYRWHYIKISCSFISERIVIALNTDTNYNGLTVFEVWTCMVYFFQESSS